MPTIIVNRITKKAKLYNRLQLWRKGYKLANKGIGWCGFETYTCQYGNILFAKHNNKYYVLSIT